MKSMKQRGISGPGPVDIDDLTYFYKPNSNTLDRVEDTRPDYGKNDFVNRNVNSQDYQYDPNGNLKADKNKGISNISYNELDLPVEVTTDANGRVTNIYDASGTLIQKDIIAANNSSDRYLYWGPFVYKNDNLEYVLNSEGRARYIDVATGYEFDFFVKDHLGNVRTVVNYERLSIQDYLATHELASSAKEALIFTGLDKRTPKPGGGGDDEMAVTLLGADAAKRVGTSLLLRVMAGDKFKAGVSAYYQGDTYVPDNDYVPAEDLASSLLSTLSGGLSAGGNEAGGTEFLNSLVSPDNFVNIYNDLKENQTDPSQPRAYLNYVLFDENMNIVPAQSGALQVNASNKDNWADLEMLNDIEVAQNGYLLTFMSNEDYATVVNMDNMLVSLTRGRLMEEQHYYPHGLVVQDGSNTPLANKFLYQGKEIQKEAGLELYDFHARQYDPQLGRFWGIDPMDQFPSGYTGMGNDPANMIDPSGMLANGIEASGANSRYGDENQDRTNYFMDGSWSSHGDINPLLWKYFEINGGAGPVGGHVLSLNEIATKLAKGESIMVYVKQGKGITAGVGSSITGGLDNNQKVGAIGANGGKIIYPGIELISYGKTDETPMDIQLVF